jgi:hypothetical protein
MGRTAREAFPDPKMLGKRLSNEGHEFSRAVKGQRMTASDLSKLDLQLANWTAHEAFPDPERLRKRLSNEGHGFSRAVKGLRA